MNLSMVFTKKGKRPFIGFLDHLMHEPHEYEIHIGSL